MNDETKPTQNDSMHALRSNQRPSLGRVVHYTPGHESETPGEAWTASIAAVYDDGSVNLGGYRSDGTPFHRLRVEQAPPGVVAGQKEARGCWAWPAYVPPTGGAR